MIRTVGPGLPRLSGEGAVPASASGDGLGLASAESLGDVVLDQLMELLRDVVAAQRQGLFAVDEHGRGRSLAGCRQTDADVGMLAFAGAVDDAAHDRDLELLDAG